MTPSRCSSSGSAISVATATARRGTRCSTAPSGCATATPVGSCARESGRQSKGRTMAGAPFIIREMADADRAAWLEMRAELWPEETIVAHAAEIDEWYKSTTAWGFVAELPNGFPVGFAEVALR